jgi:hypothetical protein
MNALPSGIQTWRPSGKSGSAGRSANGSAPRCGKEKGYLTETKFDSFRPSGLRIKRAEAWVNGLRSRILGKSMIPETFFQRLSHRASEMNELRLGIL